MTVLSGVTGLKSLSLEGDGFFERGFDIDRLSQLTALTGLTLLDLTLAYDDFFGFREAPSDVSVLSALTALRELRCSFFQNANVVPGDPLPIELGFLCSASALEVLDLGFREPFWSLPEASSRAVRQSVCGLLSLKQVSIHIEFENVEQYYLALSAFASAPSTETLSFKAYGPNLCESISLEGDEHTLAQARDCLKALTKLQSLSLVECRKGRVPHCTDLLAGLASARLTCLELDVGTEGAALVHEIARFQDLQHLLLERAVRLPCLDPLSDMKCLTCLHVTSSELDGKMHAYANSSEHWRPSQLETAICEFGRQVGFPVSVSFTAG